VDNPAATVAQLFLLAGIAPDEDETLAVVDAMPVQRESIAALYRVPGVRYEVPALMWSAVP
jgi:hypothetical protein